MRYISCLATNAPRTPRTNLARDGTAEHAIANERRVGRLVSSSATAHDLDIVLLDLAQEERGRVQVEGGRGVQERDSAEGIDDEALGFVEDVLCFPGQCCLRREYS